MSTEGIWRTIAEEARSESPLWGAALRPPEARDETSVFSPLGAEAHALGLETIYEGYLLHYGRPRLFDPADRDTAVLLGDYLYAHGLVRIAALGDVATVGDLSELISLCAQARADGLDVTRGGRCRLGGHGSGARLGRRQLAEARAALREARATPARSTAWRGPGPATRRSSSALRLHADRVV